MEPQRNYERAEVGRAFSIIAGKQGGFVLKGENSLETKKAASD